MNTIFCIVGRTCAGKDTFVKLLCKKFPELFKPVVSYTTRPKRDSETDGVEHWFLTNDEFQKRYEEETPIAYTEIGEYRYMATKEQLNDANIYIIDPDGIESLKKNFPEIPLYVIYILASDKTREDRAMRRGDDMEVFKKREEDEMIRFNEFIRADPPLFNATWSFGNHDRLEGILMSV